MLLAQVWTHWRLNRFFLPNPIFAICSNFQLQNPLKNQCLPHLSSENCEINSIKSNLPRAFQQHQEHPQIPMQFSVSILFSFHWENGWIINYLHTVAPNSLKPSWCIPTHGELSEDTRSIVDFSDSFTFAAWKHFPKHNTLSWPYYNTGDKK